ncbi:MAG: hypothetical protein KJP04_03990 [Arenicella sp.]|nr:hypothetical protein [Arenicella sp.]
MTSQPAKYDILAALLIMVAVAGVFGQTFGHQSIGYDDPHFISLVPQVLSGLSWENIQWAWSTDQMAIWHPLTWISYQLESDLFGAENDGARFVINTLLHLVNCWLVYLICKEFRFSELYALFIVLLFAVHPQHVEVVAWLSQRKELLATFFMLLSLRQFLKFRKSPSINAYVLSLVFFVFALASKVSAAPLALLLPVIYIIDFRFESQAKATSYQVLLKGLLRWLPFLAVAGVISLITANMQAGPLADKFVDLYSSLNYLLMIGIRFAWYLQMSFWPEPLSLFYPVPQAVSSLEIAQSVILIVLFFLIAWRNRSNRLFLIGVCWFVVFLAPTSGIVPVESIFVSDRYSYQAHIGLFIAVMAMAQNITPASRLIVLKTFLAAAIVIFATISWNHTANWKYAISLFKYELQTNPSSEAAAVQLGHAYFVADNSILARRHYQQAIELKPDGFYGYAYLGFLEHELGNYAAAEQLYMQGISNTSPAKSHHVKEVYERLTWISSHFKRHQQAIERMTLGLQLFPDSLYLQQMKTYYQQYYPALIDQG